MKSVTVKRGRVGTQTKAKGYRAYQRDTLSDVTRRLYESDLRHFKHWGGSIPSTPARVAAYLARYAGDLAIATLARRLIAIGRAHGERNLPNPTTDQRVKMTMRGIRRTFGVAQKQAKPLLLAQLKQVAARCDSSVAGIRDKALLMLGFAGALRRSELVAIQVHDLQYLSEGLTLNIPFSKTDQERKGRQIAIPHGRRGFCPVRALKNWLDQSGIEEGPVFRRVDRYGCVGAKALHPSTVSAILQRHMMASGLDASGFSAHSLRAGLATSAAIAGVPAWKIRQQTRHKSDLALARYIRDHQIFQNNASAAVFWRKT